MRKVFTKHFHGSLSDFYIDEDESVIIEKKTVNGGQIKEYVYPVESMEELQEVLIPSIEGVDMRKQRSLNEYRQTKEIYTPPTQSR